MAEVAEVAEVLASQCSTVLQILNTHHGGLVLPLHYFPCFRIWMSECGNYQRPNKLTELLEHEDALPLGEALPDVLQANKELGRSRREGAQVS